MHPFRFFFAVTIVHFNKIICHLVTFMSGAIVKVFQILRFNYTYSCKRFCISWNSTWSSFISRLLYSPVEGNEKLCCIEWVFHFAFAFREILHEASFFSKLFKSLTSHFVFFRWKKSKELSYIQRSIQSLSKNCDEVLTTIWNI